MVQTTSHQLQPLGFYKGEKAGKAIAKWLNKPPSGGKLKWGIQPASGQSLIQDLVLDAQVVFGQLRNYKDLRKLKEARQKKKVPPQFVESLDRLNETLATFTQAPCIELNDVYEGSFVSWTPTEESSAAPFALQIRWVLRVIALGAILKIRRCKQCQDWYFARFPHQFFCKPSCGGKKLSETVAFKAKRRKYMREYRKK